MSVDVDIGGLIGGIAEPIAIELIQGLLDDALTGFILCGLVANITELLDEALAPELPDRDPSAGPSQSVVLAASVAGVALVAAAGIGFGFTAKKKRPKRKSPASTDEFGVDSSGPLLA